MKATVQIASYNLTDSGYRRLESNLGINQAYLTLAWPEWLGSENLHLTLTVGGFTNRYGAAGRYDGGKYETYLFGRTHVAGGTPTSRLRLRTRWTFVVEDGFGAKLEPIPFYGPPNGPAETTPNQQLPAWQPYPGPVAQESAFVHHVHVGARAEEAAAHRRALHPRVRQRQRSLELVHRRRRPPLRPGRVDGQRVRRRRPSGQRPEAVHHHQRRRRQAAERRPSATATSALAPQGAERPLHRRRHRDAALVRRLAAPRQLLRHAGRHRPGHRQRSTASSSSTSSASRRSSTTRRRSGARARTWSCRCSGCSTRSNIDNAQNNAVRRDQRSSNSGTDLTYTAARRGSASATASTTSIPTSASRTPTGMGNGFLDKFIGLLAAADPAHRRS